MKLFLSIFLLFFLVGAAPDDARKANEAYNNGNYTRAAELYKKAIKSDPDNARLYFNLGNALTKAGQVDNAIQVFEQYKSMVDDPGQMAKANYNIGNAYTKSQQWDKAINYYKDALKFEADDEDAKHNYELAQMKKEEQQEQQNQQNQQNGDQRQNQQNQQNQQQQNRQDQQNSNNRQQQQNNQNDTGQNQRPSQDQQQSSNRISKEQAEKILQALEQKEKELLRQFKKQKTDSNSKTNAKDW